jgi:predicted ATPase/DNA-binding CsgD family transcriptional regulator
LADQDNQSIPQAREFLTRREQDILALLAQDFSDREIADRLVVSLNTVKWYNRQIFDKLGVENRRQAAARAFTLRLVGLEQSSGLPQHNLPAQTTPFIGRIGELEMLTRLLVEGPSRLVTLLAPGGMGKTRLALAAAEVCLPQFADGVYFVPLVALTSPSQLVPAIADATGFQLTSGYQTPRQQVLNFLSDKHMLLLLDNFEHLVDGAALLNDFLEAAPRLRFLVTSRERLNLSSETLYALGGMGYPESPQIENALDYSAVQFFFECGRRLAPQTGFEDTASIIRVCQLTQGMPLAIELAAAWLAALSPSEIAREIAQGLDFLQTTLRDIPDRQRSIRAVFEASWQHLNAEEQRVFRELSVFRGGFTREAAQAVSRAGTDTLIGLANKALISRHPNRGRFEVHELLRQFAEEQLKKAGDTQATRGRHATYFAHFLSARVGALQSRSQQATLDEIELDFDNVREAVNHLLDLDQLVDFMPVAESLRLFFEARVHLSSSVHHPGLPYTSLRLSFEARAHYSADATALFRKALTKARRADAEVSIREGLGDCLQVTGAYEQAWREFEQAKLLLSPTAFALRTRLLRKQALALDAQARFEEALQVLTNALETLNHADQRDESWWQEWIALQNSIVSANFFLGFLPPILERLDRIRAAVERYGTVLQRFDFFVSANAIELQRTAFVATGKAMDYARLGLDAANESGGFLQIALGHIRVGITYLASEQWQSAESEFLAGLASSDRVGNALTQTICATFLTTLCRRRGEVEAAQRWATLTLKTAGEAGIDLYLAAAKANLSWVAWRARNWRQAAALAEEALSIWQRVSPKYPLQWQAQWPLLGIALRQNRIEAAVNYGRQILEQPQVMPPDASLPLMTAIRAWDKGHESKCRACFSEVSTLAATLGYL